MISVFCPCQWWVSKKNLDRFELYAIIFWIFGIWLTTQSPLTHSPNGTQRSIPLDPPRMWNGGFNFSATSIAGKITCIAHSVHHVMTMGKRINLFPLLPPWTPPFGSRYRLPSLPLSAPVNGLNDDRHRRSPSPYSLWFSHLHIKRWRCIRDRLRQWSQIISAHAGYFYFRISGTNHFIFVEFRTTFFWVSTCFNGCAAPTDARLGFGTRLRWFCDRGVWWKRTFWGKFGSWNDVDSLLDWDARCQQWFEWRWQRFCCDVPDSNDSLTSRRRPIYVNLCFHLYLPSH